MRKTILTGAATTALLVASTLAPAAAADDPVWVADPAAHVDTLNGTGIGGHTVGSINNFPGPSVPFGMAQFSPDTASTYAGYQYHKEEMTGFSMNHASAGCNVFGDIPILPSVGDIGATPQYATQHYTHDDEIGEPGYYAVTFDESNIRNELTASARVGYASIDYPDTESAQLMIRPAGSLAGNSAATLEVVDENTAIGSATTGDFCGKGNTYTVYFAMEFDQDFVAHGTWDGSSVSPDSDRVNSDGAGGYFTFPAGADLDVKVAISYVSTDGALANMAAEIPDWDFDRVRDEAYQNWADALSSVRVAGGSAEDTETFYTSLYRSMLHPNVFNDVDGKYVGFDGVVRTLPAGESHFANFSDWDTYRTLIPLQTALFPERASDFAESLIRDAEQSGSLPRWPVANSATGQMTGDNVTTLISQIYTFGGQDFDVDSALDYMLAAAYDGGAGLNGYEQRPGAEIYNELEYGPQTEEFRGDHAIVGASVTQEWSIADFTIGRLAAEVGRGDVATEFQRRSHFWQNLYDPVQNGIFPRSANGAFIDAGENPGVFGEEGFDEGNAEQYLWMTPQNMDGLIAAMGGREAAADRLDDFVVELNSGDSSPTLWAGNEPNFLVPWAFNYLGKPWRTQEVVDRVRTELYTAEPDGAPGNDDLGAMSSWYVWAALGMVPATPGTTTMMVSTPTFDHASIALGTGNELRINAPGASTGNRYISGLEIDGAGWNSTALPEDIILTGGTVDYSLQATANTEWATSEDAAPPSFQEASAAVAMTANPSMVTAEPGGSVAVQVDLRRFLTSIDAVDVSATSAVAGISAASMHVSLDDQGKASETLMIDVDDAVPNGHHLVNVVATVGGIKRTWPVTVRVAGADSLFAAMTIVGTATDAAASGANFDDAGNSYSREELERVGLEPGAQITVGDLHGLWPDSPEGQPDAARLAGQTIEINGSPTSLAFVGAAVDGGATGQAIVTLDDGSEESADISFGDWVLPSESGAPVYGNSIVAHMDHRNAVTEVPGAYLYATTPYSAPDGRHIVSVALPNTSDSGRARIFAIVTDAASEQVTAEVKITAPAGEVTENEEVTIEADVTPQVDGVLRIGTDGSGVPGDVLEVDVVNGAAMATFTPDGPGTHRYTATFEPAEGSGVLGSSVQFSLVVTPADATVPDDGDGDGDQGGDADNGDGVGDQGGDADNGDGVGDQGGDADNGDSGDSDGTGDSDGAGGTGDDTAVCEIAAPGRAVAGSGIVISVDPDCVQDQDRVRVRMYSEPTDLGVHAVGADGEIAVTIPASMEAGAHTIEVLALDGTVLGTAPITVVTSDAGGELATTGAGEWLVSLLAAALLVGVGGAVVLSRRMMA